jgi:hypothetical protein
VTTSIVSSPRLRLVAALAALSALLGLPASAGAADPPTGDAAAATFYGDAANQYSHLPGAKIVQTGYFFLRPGAGTSVGYWWGSKPPSGYYPASATILARLSGGKIVAYLATLKAPNVRPLRLLMAGGDLFTATTSCWTKSTPKASPLGTGERYLFNDGGAHFVPNTRKGSATVVKLTYPWVPGTKATETNIFSAGKPPRDDVSIDVTGQQSLHIRKLITPLRQAPPLPVPAPPAKPVPKVLCQ